MHYVKKTCILRQLKNGFSADGKAISGIVKAEQYGNNIGIELSTANLATTTTGEYYCLLSDRLKRYKLLPLAEGNRFSFQSDMEIASGFYAVFCFFSGNATPIAYGVCGTLPYDIFTMVRQAFSLPYKDDVNTINEDMPPIHHQIPPVYNDELVAVENYYEKEDFPHAEKPTSESCHNAPPESGNPHQATSQRNDVKPNENDARVRHAFGTETDGYYQSIKGEIASLFEKFPTDDSLSDAYPASDWVRLKGEEGNPQQLFGLIYESGMVKYVCYAVPAHEDTPQEIKDKAYFVPVSPLTPDVGFYVLYQSAATGESIVKTEL